MDEFFELIELIPENERKEFVSRLFGLPCLAQTNLKQFVVDYDMQVISDYVDRMTDSEVLDRYIELHDDFDLEEHVRDLRETEFESELDSL